MVLNYFKMLIFKTYIFFTNYKCQNHEKSKSFTFHLTTEINMCGGIIFDYLTRMYVQYIHNIKILLTYKFFFL